MTNELRKVTAQIMSLLRKADGDAALKVLTDARDAIIQIVRNGGGVVAAGEECPPADPDCDPPENPPPGP